MEVHIIDTGYFYADGGAMFGAIPKTAWSRFYPSNEKNQCILATRSLVVKTDCGKVVLIDTGAGNKHQEVLNQYSFFDVTDIGTALQAKGIATSDITDVILTHLHFDHCGGTTYLNAYTNSTELTFPRALHWISLSQWENSINPHPLEKASYFQENTHPLQKSKSLRLIDTDIQVCPQISLRLIDGHTPGQIVVYIASPGNEIVFTGDVIPLAAHLSPYWISAYDTFPTISFDRKITVLQEAVEKSQILIFCHDHYITNASIKQIQSFFKPDKKNIL